MNKALTEHVIRELRVARESLEELHAEQYRIRAATITQRQRAGDLRALAAELRAHASAARRLDASLRGPEADH